ncbi:hypothetical protein NSPZN2_60035 [Nitrospira defluvii]|uniref:Secreted protein n=1 Tax=Nitrospira defluvii TaxID=330214 RepID=A0ABM8S6G4_9BACT|nr:hypothetical protein NSPZN2_60035 [Nitrospira defluvii]
MSALFHLSSHLHRLVLALVPFVRVNGARPVSQDQCMRCEEQVRGKAGEYTPYRFVGCRIGRVTA